MLVLDRPSAIVVAMVTVPVACAGSVILPFYLLRTPYLSIQKSIYSYIIYLKSLKDGH